MQLPLALVALLMGLAGGPHCVAMCGAACAGVGRAAGLKQGNALRAMWLFQAGRVLGYAALGGVAASSLQGLGWLTTQTAALRPVWSLFHVATMALGLLLLCKAQQPVWLEVIGKKVWFRIRILAGGTDGSGGLGRSAPLILGALWAFVPCGLLYSALLVATLTGHAAQGAAVMALFALGSGVSMLAGPWLWLKLSRRSVGPWGVRVAGLALAGSSAWALWMGLAQGAAPWCATH